MSTDLRRSAPPTPRRRRGAAPEATRLAEVLATGGVTALLQPVVELATGTRVGVEALARGPVAHALHGADALFGAGYADGLVTELDQACVGAGLTAAGEAGVRSPQTLFLNLEPHSDTDRVLPLQPPAGVQVVVELTERALLADPAAVLATVDRVRQRGWGVALDDVGVDPASLALVPLLRPDVIKLDASLVARPPDDATAAVFCAVRAEAERSGAVVLAEGIETPAHLAAARALGAQLGQGWLFGRPTRPAPGELSGPTRHGVRLDPTPTHRPDSTPFALAAATRPTSTSDGRLLVAMSRHLERQAAAAGESAVVLAAFQRHEAFRPVACRYSRLAQGSALVAALGVDMPPEPASGVRGAHLDPADPLAQEWDVVVLGPHFAALLAARPVAGQDPRRGASRTLYRHVLTHDRDLVVAAARRLAACITRSGW